MIIERALGHISIIKKPKSFVNSFIDLDVKLANDNLLLKLQLVNLQYSVRPAKNLTSQNKTCYSTIERSLSLYWSLHSSVMHYRKK
jgi:hypothetical protein